jgi:hypothetical protein
MESDKENEKKAWVPRAAPGFPHSWVFQEGLLRYLNILSAAWGHPAWPQQGQGSQVWARGRGTLQ